MERDVTDAGATNVGAKDVDATDVGAIGMTATGMGDTAPVATETRAAGRPMRYPVTPDGRYFVVRGRLWRTANPALPEAERAALARDLMAARRAVGAALRSGDPDALREARAGVQRAKVALGERGPVWWSDGAPDENRRMARNTPYAAWFAALPDAT